MRDLEQSPGWNAANRALWFVGTAVVAAHGAAILLYGPAARSAADASVQQEMMAEHADICDKLGLEEGSPGRGRCMDLMLQLQFRHEQSYLARTSGSF
jgi:hypothetical protein